MPGESVEHAEDYDCNNHERMHRGAGSVVFFFMSAKAGKEQRGEKAQGSDAERCGAKEFARDGEGCAWQAIHR